jgi:nitric oxide reductase subunit B
MDEAAQPKRDPEVSPVSKWWLRSVLMVMVLGFAGLLTITMLSYRNAPPIPDTVIDASGETLFTGDQIRSGQAIFLRYG